MIGRCLLRASVVAFAASCIAASATAAQPPTGDARGLALLARVHHAYVGVPGVAISGRTASFTYRFALVLRAGIGVAEQFVSTGPAGTTKLVALRGSPTFVRAPGSSCWRRLAPSARQSFQNIGLPFPDQPRMRVGAPRRTATGWLLPVVLEDGALAFAIDGTTLLIRSLDPAQGAGAVEHAESLRSAPRLLVPEPRC